MFPSRLAHPSEDQVWEIGICETEVDPMNLPSPTDLASPERKKRTEVRLRDLAPQERRQFEETEKKEIKA